MGIIRVRSLWLRMENVVEEDHVWRRDEERYQRGKEANDDGGIMIVRDLGSFDPSAI